MIEKRLNALREWMREHNLSAFIVPSADPHCGEYVAERWKSREWMTGFTGSAGTAVITLTDAGLWTDSRYFIQAEKQLAGSGITLHKSFQNELTGDIPEWLSANLEAGANIGVDKNIMTSGTAKGIQRATPHLNLTPCEDPFEDIWANRPSIPQSLAEIYPQKYTGQSASERISLLRNEIAKAGADSIFITPLEDIAWLLQIRGRDVEHTPVLISYLLVEATAATLFVKEEKCPQEVRNYLAEEGVTVAPYEQAPVALAQLRNTRLLLQPSKTSIAAFEAAAECQVVEAESPLTWMKAVRTKTERDGLREALIQDGVAMVKFQKWLTETIARNETVTELSLDVKLREFRAERPLFKDQSFATIAGYAANAASPHYKATEESHATLAPRGYLLLDSGGQYLNGTTDITRTIVLGTLTEDEKIDYTVVLRGHINLAMAHFPKGTSGNQLDALARMPMWERGLQYLHGTGHGVGHYLSVHEATDHYQFRMRGADAPLLLYSNITNEPALYRAGSHGCRTENMMLVMPNDTTEFGDFYYFETVTLAPIDTEPIIRSMMRPHELRWLNDYHAKVFAKLSPHLSPEEQAWLRQRCEAI